MKKTKIIKSLSFCAALCACAAIGTCVFTAKAENELSPYDTITLETGASVRYAASSSEMGFSYRLKMPVAEYDKIKDQAVFGIYLAPQDYYAAHPFNTATNIQTYYDTKNETPESGKAKLYDYQGIMGSSDGEYVYFRGSLVGVLDGTDNRANNLTRDFRAVGYVKYTLNGEDTYKFVQAENAEENIRSMAYVAEQAIAANNQAIAAATDETTKAELEDKNDKLQKFYIDKAGDPFGETAEKGGTVKVYDRANKTLTLPQVSAIEAAKENTYWKNKYMQYSYTWTLKDSAGNSTAVENGDSLASFQGNYTLVCTASKDGTEKEIYRQPYQINADFGSTPYRRSNDTFTFDAVTNAQKYELYVDDAETPVTTSATEYAFGTPLTTGEHTVKVIAFNGTARTEQTYIFSVGDKIKFNEAVTEGSDEYLLADFNTVEYREYLSVEGKHYNWGGEQTQYSISDGKLIIDPLSESGYNRVLKFTFPTPIAKADMRNIKFTLTSTKAVRIYAFGEYDEATEKYEMTGSEWNGDWVMNDCGFMTTEGVIEYGGFKQLTSDYVTGIAVTCGSNVASTVVHLNGITYEKYEPITNFNSKIEGTENEYLLADFSVNGYNDYLSGIGSGKYALSQNGLEVTEANWNGNSVLYTLPSSIAISDIEQIKVEFIVTGGKSGVVRAGDGTNFKGTDTPTSPMTFTIDTTVLTGDNLVSFLLSCNDTATTITYTRISYIKKAANN